MMVRSGLVLTSFSYNTQSLIYALKQKPGTVSVLWENDIKTRSDLTIIGEIWHGTIE